MDVGFKIDLCVCIVGEGRRVEDGCVRDSSPVGRLSNGILPRVLTYFFPIYWLNVFK